MKNSILSMIALCAFSLNLFGQPYLVPLKKGTTASSVSIAPNINQYVNGKTTNLLINPTFTGSWSPQEIAAIQYAINIWENVLTSQVPIEIEFKLATLPSTVLAQSGPVNIIPNFFSLDTRYQTDTHYPLALANKLKGFDLSTSEGDIEVNVNVDALDNGDFYLNTDMNCPQNKYDFVTTILHEIGHGVGAMFTSVRLNTSSQIVYKFGQSPNIFPVIHDRFIIGNSIGNPVNTLLTSFTTPSTALTNYVQSDNLFWNGLSAKSANNNVRPKMYAPTTFELGSSVAHLDDGTFGTSELFISTLDPGAVIHAVGPVGVGILNDIGWDALNFVGIEDDVTIMKYNPYPAPVTLTNNPDNVLSVGSTYRYHLQFSDEYPYGDYLVSSSWSLDLFHSGGKYTLQTGSTQLWQPSISSLPSGYNWLRDANGRVRGQITAIGTDNDNVSHEKIMDVGINYKPGTPYFSIENTSLSGHCNKMKLHYYAHGATSYTVSYRENLPNQFNSWVSTAVSSSPLYYEYTGLTENSSYDFKVEAINAYGGTLSSELGRLKCKHGINIYPNPVVDYANFEVLSDEFIISSLSIYNVSTSELVLYQDSFPENSNVANINVSDLPTGNYIVNIDGDDGSSEAGQFIKE